MVGEGRGWGMDTSHCKLLSSLKLLHIMDFSDHTFRVMSRHFNTGTISEVYHIWCNDHRYWTEAPIPKLEERCTGTACSCKGKGLLILLALSNGKDQLVQPAQCKSKGLLVQHALCKWKGLLIQPAMCKGKGLLVQPVLWKEKGILVQLALCKGKGLLALCKGRVCWNRLLCAKEKFL